MATQEFIDSLVGKTLAEAKGLAEAQGMKVRATVENGEHLVTTMDYNLNRINVEVEGSESKIIRVLKVG